MAWRRSFRRRYPFYVAPLAPKSSFEESRKKYALQLRRALIAVLLLMIAVFQGWKRWPQRQVVPKLPGVNVYLDVENVPVTRQGIRKPPPARPVVPIPTEEPTVPEDLTIEEPPQQTTGLENLPEGEGLEAILPPRPVAEVFPEYPEKEKKRGVQGEVELMLLVDEKGTVQNVQVLRNTTGSKLCARAAVQAAYQTKFFPARKKNRFVAVWIRKTYKFGLD